MSHQEALPPGLVPLAVPVPPGLAEAFGYPGEARFVGFSWLPGGDEVLYDDRRMSGTGRSHAFLAWKRHRAVFGKLQPYNLGASDQEAEHWLVLDRDEGRVWVGPVAAARSFLDGQYPPPPELSPYELEEARRAAGDAFEALLASGWEEEHIDPEEVRQALRRDREAVSRLVAYLDQWPGN